VKVWWPLKTYTTLLKQPFLNKTNHNNFIQKGSKHTLLHRFYTTKSNKQKHMKLYAVFLSPEVSNYVTSYQQTIWYLLKYRYYIPLVDEKNVVLDIETWSQAIQTWQLAAALARQQIDDTQMSKHQQQLHEKSLQDLRNTKYKNWSTPNDHLNSQ